MRQALPALALCALAVVPAAVSLGGPAAAAEPLFGLVERGRYLAAAGNCVSCHTAEHDGEPFAGGRGLETPFGTIYTPNITFDDETGIGRWSREDFRRALRKGERPDGAQLYPAFPYPWFTHMPDADVDAIYAFLSTLPTVRKETPENALPFPLSVREAVTAWNALYLDEGPLPPAPHRSEAWRRGRYLVEGPGHCGACHSDKNLAGASAETLIGTDAPEEHLTGGVLEHWLAPEIHAGPGGLLEDWSPQDVAEFLGTGRNRHASALTRMGEVVVNSTSRLTEADRLAIGTYLASLEGPEREEEDEDETLDAAAMAAGEAIYADACSACHRADGSGVDRIFGRLDGSAKLNARDPTTVIRIVLEGARSQPTDRHPSPISMPAFDWKLSDRQVADVLTWLRRSWGNDAPPVDPETVGDLRETLAEAR